MSGAARDRANMADVLMLLRERASAYKTRPSPRRLADSLSCERFPYPPDGPLCAALVRFRTLRQDARVAAARRALGGDQ